DTLNVSTPYFAFISIIIKCNFGCHYVYYCTINDVFEQACSVWSCLKKLKMTILALCLIAMLSYAAAYDPLDPTGNITIKWDIMSWTEDGYLAAVSINNLQLYRQIGPPGWQLGWTWAGKEIIWSMVGAQTTEEGDCSNFKLNIPHCCKKSPTVIDLLPNAPYTQQFTNCCKGGVIPSLGQNPNASLAQFQVSVGQAGTSVYAVVLPKAFTLLGPGPGYTCGPAKIVPSTIFFAKDRRRKTQALSKFCLP
ncbi:hypothetical protein KSS87_000434, partial [Heliosperma pusillum]